MGWPGWQDYQPGRTAAPAKPHKYRAQPTTVDGILFPSKHEAARYVELRALEAAGAIQELQRQVPFALETVDVHGLRVCITRFVADFVYREAGVVVVEDAKGYRGNPVWMLKRRWFEAQYGIPIRQT